MQWIELTNMSPSGFNVTTSHAFTLLTPPFYVPNEGYTIMFRGLSADVLAKQEGTRFKCHMHGGLGGRGSEVTFWKGAFSHGYVGGGDFGDS